MMKTQLKKLGLMSSASLFVIGALSVTASAFAQDAPAPADNTVVVVTGQRAALKSAQKIKQTSGEIVDSIVADDIGKLPDRSVTEALQRVVGVTIDHNFSKGDPEHYSVEGSGVNIRGLTYVRSELNGRDSFSANGGRSLNFEDVPPELMAGVDIYKNPSAEQIEGAVGGLVNLRTALPFDYKGQKAAVSIQGTYSTLKKGDVDPSASALYSNRWSTGAGDFGALFDIAYSRSGTRTDAFQVEPYYPRTNIVPGKTVWIPKGAQWRTLEFDRKRFGAYGALQWRPNEDLLTTLTFFNSHYEMQWNEQAIFAQSSPYNIQVSSDATYDANGALLTGTLTDPTDGGINFGDDTRTSTRKSDTTDVAWNLKWTPSDKWTLTTDLQYIRANTRSFDSTVATGVTIPSETLDLRGDVPRITVDEAYLANANNYYWAFTMEHMDKSIAHEWAWRADAKYDIDKGFLKDVRFGVRTTDRDATTQNSNPSYNWAAITQPWQIGWDISGLAYLGDPRFAGNTSLHSFDNFFNGKLSAPSLVFPNVSLATGYPDSYTALHKYHDILCAEAHGGDASACSPWTPATFGTDPAGTNKQTETTQAVYTQLRFGWDNLKYPVDGNIGIRYVQTDMTAFGYTVFSPTAPNIPAGNTVGGVTIPNIPAYAKAEEFHNKFNNVLPSLNLRMKVSPEFQVRFAIASALSRPDFTQLQGYTSLSQGFDITTTGTSSTINSVNLTGTSAGNPYLKPTTSTQTDLTAEWYFSPVGSLTFAVFNKDLHDIVISQLRTFQLPDVNGQLQNFTTTGPINGADGTARGMEIAYQQYYDFLPGWLSGFGVQANFTYVDSSQHLYTPVTSQYCTVASTATPAQIAASLNLNLNGCDTDARTFGNLPLAYLSRYAYNLAIMYDKGPISARLAYNWRSKYLQAVNVNGTQGGDAYDSNPASATYGTVPNPGINWGLPTWADDYGQLDASFFYKINEKLTFGVEAQNINDAQFRQLMQQHIGTKGRAWFVSGPRYTAQLRYTF
ncbi:TonB-dependent receptor [Asticcacaulis sp. 201]|uniref:TonB-dependent receptor n=1 Tax=Asticcacaulis sp. 201 TaxID=3028787 RepID=UPI002915EB43|nr:TonB-dependent receptor [Asticcacaulis sp. 201]MDV6332933.1 TonB-dependent receptor [Asticcacaulis sp. 201]